jgi:predicted  nucleic acid-binding Zn-ribbon protein
MIDGLAKAMEVLGARISSLESSEAWARQDADKAKKERDRYLDDVCRLNEEISDLKKQCFEANEKVRAYESMTIIDNEGKIVRIVDLPEILVPSELEKEIQASLDRGKAPGKVTE